MHLHVLGIARSSILLVGGEVHHGASRDWDIDISLGLARSDLGSLGVQGDGDLAALLSLLGSASIVDHRLWT